MIVIGLTGSVATGKSTTKAMFEQQGLPVFCADEAVHELLEKNKSVVGKIKKEFPEAVVGNSIDRQRLFEEVNKRKNGFERLEKILHPAVLKMCRVFIQKEKKKGTKVLLLDIPLLFEADFEKLCDVTVCVFCSAATQKRRALLRVGMTARKFNVLKRRQLPQTEKKRRADFSISTENGRAQTRKDVLRFLKQIEGDLK